MQKNLGGAVLIDARGRLDSGSSQSSVSSAFSSPSLNISNVIFSQNRAHLGGAVAIYGSSSHVLLSNDTFASNFAASSGGAVHFRAEGRRCQESGGLTVERSSFLRNAADEMVGRGGGLSVYGGNDLDIWDGETAKSCSWKDRVRMISSHFEENSAFVGGAVYSTGAAVEPSAPVQSVRVQVLVFDNYEDCSFRKNRAELQGGAMRLDSIYGGVSVSSSYFVENSAVGVSLCPGSDETCAGSGGGLMSVYAPLTLSSCSFKNNSAATATQFSPRGGGVFVSYDSSGPGLMVKDEGLPKALVVMGGSFVGNVASALSSGSTGGAIWINGAASIEGTLFHENVANSRTRHSLEYNAGGAIYVGRFANTLHGNNFTHGIIVMKENNFTANRVHPGGYGGALFVKGSTDVSLVRETFKHNSVTSSFRLRSAGGAVALVSGVTGTLTDCIFDGNRAVAYRGTPLIVPVSGSAMPTSNGQSGEGGAMFLEASSALIISSTFENNFCTSGGSDEGATGGALSIVSYLTGAIPVSQPNFPRQPELYKVTFRGNSVRAGGSLAAEKSSGMGGAVHVLSAAPDFVGCDFIGNSVQASGGFKISFGGAVTIRYSYLVKEEQGLTSFGAALDPGNGYVDSSSACRMTRFLGCNFTSNAALGEDSQRRRLYRGGRRTSVQSGRGGAIAAIASQSIIEGSTFDGNWVTAEDQSMLPSLGGAIYLDYYSKASITFTKFSLNQAINGAGNQVCSIARKEEEASGGAHEGSANLGVRGARGGDDPGESLLLEECRFSTSSPIPSHAFTSASTIGSSDVLILGGNARIKRCTYYRGMKIAIAGANSDEISMPVDINLDDAKVNFEGEMEVPKIEILSISADLQFSSSEGPAAVKSLKVVNGTVASSGIAVEGDAWLFGARLIGLGPSHNNHPRQVDDSKLPIFKVAHVLHLLTPAVQFFDGQYGFLKNLPNIEDLFLRSFEHPDWVTNAPMSIDGLTLCIVGALEVSVSTIHLNNSASIKVDEPGVLRFNSPTTIVDHTPLAALTPPSNNLTTVTPAIANYGRIEHSELENTLTLFGDFQQFESGSVSIEVPSKGEWLSPIWQFEGGGVSNIQGTIRVNFSEGCIMDVGDSWRIASLTPSNSSERRSSLNADTIASDEGVSVSASYENAQDSIMIYVDSIDCGRLFAYADKTEAPCSVCLAKRSAGCFFCDGTCMPPEKLMAVEPGASCNFKNCCPFECSNNGLCNGSTGACTCDWWHEGISCSSISIDATLAITCGISVTLLFLISVSYCMYHNRRKQEVVENTLEELRAGLLSNSDDRAVSTGKKGSIHVRFDYIQDLQKQLLLKDVTVPISEVDIENEVGKGTFGVVYKGAFRGAAVAVKMIRAFGMVSADIENFKREAYLMSRLRHPNIVLIMGIAMKGEYEGRSESLASRNSSDDECMERPSTVESLYILSEYMERGSLADIMLTLRDGGEEGEDTPQWTYELILACALQAARGMQYLHNSSPPICHRDLKSSNLVVDEHWVVKVTDFGVSRMLDSNGEASVINPSSEIDDAGYFAQDSCRESAVGGIMSLNIGTTAWAAPEILIAKTYGSYSLKVDVYSFGIVLWELWEKDTPFKEFTSRFDMADAIRCGARPQLSSDCPEGLQNLYNLCVQTDPSKRPNFNKIVQILTDEISSLRANSSSTDDSFTYLPWMQPRTTSSTSNIIIDDARAKELRSFSED